MRAISVLLFSFVFTLSSCDSTASKGDGTEPGTAKTVQVDKLINLLRHVVLFNFNETATEDTVKEIENAFAELPNKISEIHSFEWGTNNSPEGLDKGFTHCFFVTFLKEDDRAKYLPHPDHQAFVKMIGPYVEDVTVFDYWTE